MVNFSYKYRVVLTPTPYIFFLTVVNLASLRICHSFYLLECCSLTIWIKIDFSLKLITICHFALLGRNVSYLLSQNILKTIESILKKKEKKGFN